MSEFFVFANNHPFWAVVMTFIVCEPLRYLAVSAIAAWLRPSSKAKD